jgi:MerR family transcriptional regulator, light-induced transcriptional regulator
MGYRIKTVSELTGIPKNTLVAWERRYGILNPERQPNGYRMYSDEDVALLVQLKTALAEGLQISEAVELVRDKPPIAPPTAAVVATDDVFATLRDQLERALLAYDRTRASQLTERLIGMAHGAAIDGVYFPLLRSIGDAWERGDVTVAQEHFASSFVREQLIAMLLGLRCGPPHGIHVACTTFPDDPHELGVLGLAVMLANHGCRVTYLGANTPRTSLAGFAAGQKPAWLCISTILETEERTVTDYASELRARVDASTRIAIGGAGLPECELSVAGVSFMRDWHALELLS